MVLCCKKKSFLYADFFQLLTEEKGLLIEVSSYAINCKCAFHFCLMFTLRVHHKCDRVYVLINKAN